MSLFFKVAAAFVTIAAYILYGHKEFLTFCFATACVTEIVESINRLKNK